MKWHYLIWVAGSILFLIGSVGLSIGDDADVRFIYDDDVYRRTFDDFYSRLEGLPGDVLVDEMEEQIESALMRGRNISPADLQHKIRQIDLKIHGRLQSNFCRNDSAGWSQTNIELGIIDSVRAGLTGYKVKSKGDYARIVSVLVRIMEGTKTQFCNSIDFRDLAP